MELRFEIISCEQAMQVSEFIVPWLDNSDEYTYYVAIADDRFAGLLVANQQAVAPEIVSIGISDEYKSKGVATALLEFAVADILSNYDQDELLVENSISAWVAGPEEEFNTLKRVFEKNGFVAENEGRYYEATLAAVAKSKKLSDLRLAANVENSSIKYMSLKEIPHKLINAFGNHMVNEGIFLNVDPAELDEDMTCFGVDEKGICSCMLFAKEDDGVFLNTFLYRDEERTSATSLMNLFYVCANNALDKCYEDNRVLFWIGEETTDKMIKDLIPKAEAKDYGARFTLSFEDAMDIRAERFESAGMEIVDNGHLCCKDCAHCTDAVLRCALYKAKPDAVLDGGECPDYKKK